MLAQEKAHASSTSNQEVDLDELMDVSWSMNYIALQNISCYSHGLIVSLCQQDPELEKLHADRIAALKVKLVCTCIMIKWKSP